MHENTLAVRQIIGYLFLFLISLPLSLSASAMEIVDAREPTPDLASSLSENDNLNCPLCYQSSPRDYVFELHEGSPEHLACLSCLEPLLKVAIERFKSEDITPHCPYLECKAPLELHNDSALMKKFSALDKDVCEQTLLRVKKAQKFSDGRLRREASRHVADSRNYLCGQYLLTTAKCLACTSCCGCCVGLSFTLDNIEHCPQCHARYRTVSGCTHMRCENRVPTHNDEHKECKTQFERGQQANCPFYFCVWGCYWRYFCASVMCLPCCPCIAVALHHGSSWSGPACWCSEM